jgi:hypothetical protein
MSISNQPEHFVRGNADDARRDLLSWIEMEGKVCARERDPYQK